MSRINIITLQFLQIFIGQVRLLSPCREACGSVTMCMRLKFTHPALQLVTDSDQNKLSLSTQDGPVHHNDRIFSEVQGVAFLAYRWACGVSFSNNLSNLKPSGRKAFQSFTRNAPKSSFFVVLTEEKQARGSFPDLRGQFQSQRKAISTSRCLIYSTEMLECHTWGWLFD